jgi:hypothetical protein
MLAETVMGALDVTPPEYARMAGPVRENGSRHPRADERATSFQ